VFADIHLPLWSLVHEPVVQRMTEYLERRSYFGVFFLLFLGAFGPSPPEEFILLIAGYLIFKKVARFPFMIGAELGGIVVSDLILYSFGVVFGKNLDRHKLMRKVFPPHRVARIRESFHRHRYRLIFLARYLYGLRPVVFFTAGASKMRLVPFVLCDLGASLINCLAWTGLGLYFGNRIEDAIKFSREWEGILLGVALALILYFVVERILVKKGVVSERSFWIRQATGTKIAAVVAMVVVTLAVGRFLFPHGVREGLHLSR
jgi:membrane protein DedA with SNARE-associated domain